MAQNIVTRQLWSEKTHLMLMCLPIAVFFTLGGYIGAFRGGDPYFGLTSMAAGLAMFVGAVGIWLDRPGWFYPAAALFASLSVQSLLMSFPERNLFLPAILACGAWYLYKLAKNCPPVAAGL